MASRKQPLDKAAYDYGASVAEQELLLAIVGSPGASVVFPVTPSSEKASATAADMARGMAVEALGTLEHLEGMQEVANFLGRLLKGLQNSGAGAAQKAGEKS
jgi:hypothetical protein